MTAPTLAASGHSISETAIGWNRTTTVVTVKFNEAVKNFDTPDVSLLPGAGRVSTVSAVSPGADGSSDTWQVSITSVLTWNSSSKLQNSVAVNLAGVKNTAGEAGTGTMNVPGILYDVDAIKPVITIWVDGSGLTATETSPVKVSFKEPVIGFDLEDMRSLIAQNATLSDFKLHTDGTSWVATLTPNAGAEGANLTISLDTENAGVTDLAGNKPLSKIVYSNAYFIDLTPPTLISFTISDHDLRAGETATVTLTFSERALGIISRTGERLETSIGTLSALSSSEDGKTWTATLTPPENTIAPDNTVRMTSLDGIRDPAGNS
uniref:Ig-like domain-containing protein n=1 Tax=Verminephrobacter aporrectodeae TaxID=1110389 RepID=UPI0002377010